MYHDVQIDVTILKDSIKVSSKHAKAVSPTRDGDSVLEHWSPTLVVEEHPTPLSVTGLRADSHDFGGHSQWR